MFPKSIAINAGGRDLTCVFCAWKNDRYLILTAQLYDAKDMAAEAKTKGDKAAQRTAQDRIRVIQQGERPWSPRGWTCSLFPWPSEDTCCLPEMKPLEAHPVFNPAIKASDAPQKPKKALPVGEDKEDGGFKLFEQAAKEAPREKGGDKGDGVRRQHTCFLLSGPTVRAKCLHVWAFGDPVALFYVVAMSTVPTTSALFRATALF